MCVCMVPEIASKESVFGNNSSAIHHCRWLSGVKKSTGTLNPENLTISGVRCFRGCFQEQPGRILGMRPQPRTMDSAFVPHQNSRKHFSVARVHERTQFLIFRVWSAWQKSWILLLQLDLKNGKLFLSRHVKKNFTQHAKHPFCAKFGLKVTIVT